MYFIVFLAKTITLLFVLNFQLYFANCVIQKNPCYLVPVGNCMFQLVKLPGWFSFDVIQILHFVLAMVTTCLAYKIDYLGG